MGIAARDITSPSQQLLDFAFKDAPPVMQTYPAEDYHFDTIRQNRYNNPQDVFAPTNESPEAITLAELRIEKGGFDTLKFLRLAQEERADIDISGPEFDFIRSIVVWDIRNFSHSERGRDEDCSIQYYGQKGTYGPQGEFSYSRVDLNEVPTWAIPRRLCRPASYRRGVGVEWRSYQNEYGNEWISY
jgi:hypothetical protein